MRYNTFNSWVFYGSAATGGLLLGISLPTSGLPFYPGCFAAGVTIVVFSFLYGIISNFGLST